MISENGKDETVKESPKLEDNANVNEKDKERVKEIEYTIKGIKRYYDMFIVVLTYGTRIVADSYTISIKNNNEVVFNFFIKDSYDPIYHIPLDQIKIIRDG